MPRAAHEAAGSGDALEEYAPATTSSSAPTRGALTLSGISLPCARPGLRSMTEARRPRRSSPARSKSGAQVTTRTGDDGYTGLLGKQRVPKSASPP